MARRAGVTVEDLKKHLSEKGLTHGVELIEMAEAEIQGGGDTEGQRLFEELAGLDPEALKEDYFHDGQWDVEGLKDDVKVAQEKQQATPAASETGSEGEQLFDQLRKLDSRASKEDYFDSGTWDLEGLKDDLKLAGTTAASAGGSEGEELFAKLRALDSAADKEDYFDASAGAWDMEGLESDIELAQKSAPAPAAVSGSSQGEELFAKLSALDSAADKEDYFDPSSGAWDIEGLESDIELAQKSAPAPAADSGSSQGEELFAKLSALDSAADKEDYFDPSSGAWDVEGLESDIQLAQKSAPAPAVDSKGEELFAKLSALDSAAGKEDYFDPSSGAWDIEGLESDIELAQKSSPAPASDSRGEEMFAKLSALDSAADKEDYFDPSAGAWDIEGLESDIELAQKSAPAPVADASSSRGEELFAKLTALDSKADKEDYFDPSAGSWDIEGLESDIELAQRAATASTGTSEGDQLFEKLTALDSKADKEDYFDASSGAWDMEGLKDDLRLAEQPPQAGGAEAAEAERLLGQLQAMDSSVQREDYFDPEESAWDIEGLRDDVELARKAQAEKSKQPAKFGI